MSMYLPLLNSDTVLDPSRQSIPRRSNSLMPEYQAKAEEGLSKLLAFLREMEELDRQKELQKLIPVGVKVCKISLSAH